MHLPRRAPTLHQLLQGIQFGSHRPEASADLVPLLSVHEP